jgi:hypothetical protein
VIEKEERRRRRRSEAPEETICVASRAAVSGPAENRRSANTRTATPARGHFGRGKLSRSIPGAQQARVVAKRGNSLRELEETAYWLELLKDAGIVAADQLDSLARKCDEPTAIFVTTLKMSKETPS